MTGLSRIRTAATVGAAVVCSLFAVWLFAAVPADGGDVDLRLDVRPSLRGGVVVDAPPLGTLSADAFVGVARVAIEVGDVRPAAAEAAVSAALAGETPAVLEQDPVDVFTEGVTSGMVRLAVAALVVGTVGGAVGAVALRRTPAAAAGGAAVGAATVLLMAVVAAVTYDPYAFQEPRATGAFAVRSAMGDPGVGRSDSGAFPAPSTGAPSSTSAPTVPQPDVGSMLGKLQRNLTGLYNGFLLPEVSRTAREGSQPVIVARLGTDPSLLSALARSTGAETVLLLSGGPFVTGDAAGDAVGDVAGDPASGPAGDGAGDTAGDVAAATPPSIPGVSRVLTYADLPQTVGATTFYRHPSGPVTLAGPGTASLVIGPDGARLPRTSNVPHVALDRTNRVLVVYLDPTSGVLRAYDVVDRTEASLDVVRSNADGLR